ncbi:hypothetical protein RRF57_009520 [Xylaria bambusicola]|uniref:Uncharacterized protein n=1 Tax=Xylaria bambusicola TaxID=326684 RepID=A0AAN7UWY5_9PEZI
MSQQPSHNPTFSTARSFCQAIYFYYICGCRTNPVFCCQPSVNSSTKAGNPCRHEQPVLVVAKLPRACGKLLGSSAACDAEDPGAKRFVREADTSERLELAVSDGLKQDMVRDALPEKVEGTFTIDEVVSKSRRREKFKSFLSATATPFIPRLGVPKGNVVTPEISKIAENESCETARDIPGDNTVVSENEVTLAIGEEEETKCSDFANELNANEANQSTEVGDYHDNQDDSDQFYEIELSPPDTVTTVANESCDERISKIDDTTLNESIGLEPRRSYEELTTFWAIDNSKEKPKPSRTCYWAVATLFSNLIR